jgi:hypothetical protein
VAGVENSRFFASLRFVPDDTKKQNAGRFAAVGMTSLTAGKLLSTRRGFVDR